MITQKGNKKALELTRQAKRPYVYRSLKNMLKSNKEVASERISTKQYNKEIDASIVQIEIGQTNTHRQMESELNNGEKNNLDESDHPNWSPNK